METSADRIYQLEQCGDGIANSKNASIYQLLLKRKLKNGTHETIWKMSSNYFMVKQFFWHVNKEEEKYQFYVMAR